MENLWIALITGLTTGGLSCLAVQGGLLASSLAGQIEKEVAHQGSPKIEPGQVRLAGPILVFLAAKLTAYTLLGALLGWAGQMFQLSPAARSVLQIAIGVFMLGSALRMLNVHPIFRYFAFEPPAALRRWLRSQSKSARSDSLISPAFMGLLTVLIPCGVTQAMMAVALATGDPLQSAALMFAFTLGTSPVFFFVSYFATRLGAKLEKYFLRFTAIALLVLGLITLNSGFTLAGSPLAFSRITSGLFSQPSPAAGQAVQATAVSTAVPAAPGSAVTLTLDVKNNGYEPKVLQAPAGVPIQLRLVTENVRSCSRAFTIPALNVQQILQESGEAVIEIPAQPAGSTLPFACSMGMYSGTIVFN